jgi:quercetin dioxygenase-like cupin family protein
MRSIFWPQERVVFSDHPRFANVSLAVLVSSRDTGTVSVSMLAIAPAAGIPVHTHDPQVDSIYVVAGSGEIFVNGGWQQVTGGDYVFAPAGEEHGVRNTGATSLQLLVHHSPPLL